MADFSNAVLGVTGASGAMARTVITNLKQRGAKRIVAVTREPARIADIEGVEARAGDFSRLETLDSAFRGIDRLLIVSATDLGVRIARHVAAIDAAERAGVSHLLYTSITSPYPHAAHGIQNDHFWTEARLFQTRGGWTALRDNLYADFLVWGAARTLADGVIYHSAGAGARSLVFRDDIAAAAAGALLMAEGQQIVDVSGPAALSYAEIAAIFSRVSGRPVKAVEISPEAQLEGMGKAGVPAVDAQALTGLDVAARRGLLAIVGDGVQRFAGREPQSLEAALEAALKG